MPQVVMTSSIGQRRYNALMQEYEMARKGRLDPKVNSQEWMDGKLFIDEEDFAGLMISTQYSCVKVLRELQEAIESLPESPERRLRVVMDISRNNKPIARLLLPKV